MKYFTIEIVTVNDATAQAIYERADYKAALSAHHQALASAMANPDCTECVSIVLNSAGGIHKIEHWSAQTQPAEV